MSEEKKIAVFNQLMKEKKPISAQALLKSLGTNYSSRSVRRWLSDWVKNGKIEAVGEGRNRKYQLTPSKKTHIGCFSENSVEILKQIKRPLFQRLPTAYAEDWFDEYQPNVSSYLPISIQEELSKVGNRSSDAEPAGTFAHKIYHRLLIDLSYNSSRLEGNTYSLIDTKRLILEGEGAEGKLDEEKVMILNHKEAIRYLVDRAADLDISSGTVFKLHYLLADSLLEKSYAGNVRDHGVRIGGSTYIPYENPKKLKLQLGQIMDKAKQIQNSYEQSFFLLVHLTYLQAFLDVNKRTARLASNIPLIKGNFAPLSFNDVEKKDYIAAVIAIYELQDVRPLADLYAFSYLRSCAAYDSTLKAIGFNEVRVRYRQERREVIRHIILSLLTGNEMIDYATSQTNKLIPKKDQADFLKEVHEDLTQLDETRIVGLGVTPEEFKKWQTKA